MPGDSHTIQDSDVTLLERVRHGDESAFELLFRRYSPNVLRFAHSLTFDADIAEDLMQEVFGWLWMHHAELRQPDNLLAYLLGAVRNRALHRLRTERHRTSTSTKSRVTEESGMHEPDRSIEEIIEQRDSIALIWHLVAQFPEPRRTIFVLRWQHGLDWESIANIVGISVGAAKTQHSRTLEQIRHQFPSTFGV